MEEAHGESGRSSFVAKFESLAITTRNNKAIRKGMYKNYNNSCPLKRRMCNESGLILLIKSWSLEDVFNPHLFKSKVLFLISFLIFVLYFYAMQNIYIYICLYNKDYDFFFSNKFLSLFISFYSSTLS